MRYELSAGDGYIEVKTHGKAELAGFEVMIKAILGHPRWTPGGNVLINHSDLDVDAFTTGDINAVASLVGALADRSARARCAFVVGNDLQFGLMRMWKSLAAEHWEGVAMIFRTRDAAVSWLKQSGAGQGE